jgi:hypothetical protein
MSHPDPLHDEENTMSQDSFDRFDDMAERTIYPWIDDESHDRDDINYDDFNDFTDGEGEEWDDTYDDSMDGDHESGLASAGWGTDEDYGYFGDYNDDGPYDD